MMGPVSHLIRLSDTNLLARPVASAMVALGLLTLLGGRPACFADEANPSGDRSGAASGTAAPKSFRNLADPGLDSIGDPLPPRAMMRLGTHRFQHPGSVSEMVVATDESYVLSLSNSVLIAWDATTGKELWRRDWPGPRVNAASYGQQPIALPNGDSTHFFTPGKGPTVLRWDVSTGEYQTIELVPEDDGDALIQQPHRDLKSIDVAADQGTFLVGGSGALGCFNREGASRWIVPNRPEQPMERFNGRDRLKFGGDYASGKFSPDGSLVAALFSEAPTKIRLLNAETGEQQSEIATADNVVRMTFSSDGRALFATHRDCSVRKYEINSGMLEWEFVLPPDPNGAESYASAIDCSDDGELVAAGIPIGSNYWIYLIDAASGQQRSVLKSDMWKPWAVQFADDGRVLFSSGWDAAIRRWDIATGEELPLPVGRRASATVTISPDGSQVAFIDGRGDARVLDSRTGTQRNRLPADSPEALLFAPGGDRLFSGGPQGKDLQVQVWDLSNERPVHRWQWPIGKDPHSGIEELATDRNGKRLAAVSFRQDKAWVWSIESGERLCECAHSECYGLAVSPDAQTLVTVGWDKQIRVWDAGTGKLRQTVDVEEKLELPEGGAADTRMYGVRFSPDGTRLAVCHMDGKVSIWDAGNVDQLELILNFEVGSWFTFGAIDYSSDALWIATGDAAGNITLFDAHTGEKMLNVGKHEDHVYTLRFGRGGDRLVSGGGGVSYLWSLDHAGTAAELDFAELWDRIRVKPVEDNSSDERLNQQFDALIAISQSQQARQSVSDRLRKIKVVIDAEALPPEVKDSPVHAALLREVDQDDATEFALTVYHALLALKMSGTETEADLSWMAEQHPNQTVRQLASELQR